MENKDKIGVLLAEDHVIVREGTRELLQGEADMEVVGEASDGEEAVELTRRLKPNVVVMDIAMPKLNGIEATRRIKQIHPRTAVLILTAYDNDQYIAALLEAGAAGYLLKNIRGGELIDAIRAVFAGESILHPTIAHRIIEQLRPTTPQLEEAFTINPLTEREAEVLKLAAKGVSNRDIAQRLYLSDRTVQSHFSNVFKKLAVASRTEAILYGLRRGWFTMEDLP